MISKLQLKVIQKESTEEIKGKQYILRKDTVQTEIEQHSDHSDQVAIE